MRLDSIRSYCLSFPYVEESFPFDDNTLVFKVGGKMFALLDLKSSNSFNIKCAPEYVIERQEKYFGVLPGYHMNKKHWITVKLNSDVNQKEVQEWIKDSYFLVFNVLSKKLQREIATR